MADFENLDADGADTAGKLAAIYRYWYDLSLKPLLVQAKQDDRKLRGAIEEWTRWLRGISFNYADGGVSNPAVLSMLTEGRQLLVDGLANGVRQADQRMVSSNNYLFIQDALGWSAIAISLNVHEDPAHPLDALSVVESLSIKVRFTDISFPNVLPYTESATLSFSVFAVIAGHAPIFDLLPDLELSISGADQPSESSFYTSPNANGQYRVEIVRAESGPLRIDIIGFFPSLSEPVVTSRIHLDVPAQTP